MTQLFAQPYDISANGFYFESLDEFQSNAAIAKNDFGDPVEEFEIQFIDGENIDCDLAKAWGINQANIGLILMQSQIGKTTKSRCLLSPLVKSVTALILIPFQRMISR